MKNNYCVATFHSVHDALHFEKIIKANKLDVQLIPVPREISSSCGIAARFSPEIKAAIEIIANNEPLGVEGFYTLEREPRKSILGLFNK